MNRKLISLIYGWFALFCLICNGSSIDAQTSDGTATTGAGTTGAGTTGAGTTSTGTSGPGTTGTGTSGYSSSGMPSTITSKNTYLTNSGNVYINGRTPGIGMTIPPSWAYGAYCAYGDGSGCGHAGWYQCNFGGITRGYGPICGWHNCGNGYANCCFVSYGYGHYGFGGCGTGRCGRGGCGYGNSCGCGISRRSCMPACCSPMATCCGAISCGAVMIQPGTVVQAPGHTTPTLLNNPVTALPADTAKPAPSPNPEPSTDAKKSST